MSKSPLARLKISNIDVLYYFFIQMKVKSLRFVTSYFLCREVHWILKSYLQNKKELERVHLVKFTKELITDHQRYETKELSYLVIQGAGPVIFDVLSIISK